VKSESIPICEPFKICTLPELTPSGETNNGFSEIPIVFDWSTEAIVSPIVAEAIDPPKKPGLILFF
jgi:hypothetical protein